MLNRGPRILNVVRCISKRLAPSHTLVFLKYLCSHNCTLSIDIWIHLPDVVSWHIQLRCSYRSPSLWNGQFSFWKEEIDVFTFCINDNWFIYNNLPLWMIMIWINEFHARIFVLCEPVTDHFLDGSICVFVSLCISTSCDVLTSKSELV